MGYYISREVITTALDVLVLVVGYIFPEIHFFLERHNGDTRQRIEVRTVLEWTESSVDGKPG